MLDRAKTIHCEVLSPLISNRMYNMPELRPSELKGLIRYTYRIANYEPGTKNLFEEEVNCFGGAKENKSDASENIETIASPVRIQMQAAGSLEIRKGFLLKHRCEKFYPYNEMNERKNPVVRYINPEQQFTISLTIRLNSKKDIDWYEDMLNLSLALGGMGMRSRRGRGCVDAHTFADMDQTELLEWVKKVVKQINPDITEDFFNMEGTCLCLGESRQKWIQELNRPVVQKIWIGGKISAVENWLKAVDYASHDVKYSRYKQKKPFATGMASPRFASSVLVSLVKLNDGIYPIYTYVKPVRGTYNKEKRMMEYNSLDEDFSERNDFVKRIEGRGTGR